VSYQLRDLNGVTWRIKLEANNRRVEVMKHCILICLSLILVGGRASTAIAQNASEFRVVALTNREAPNSLPGFLFAEFGSPMINDRGQTAFVAGVKEAANPSQPRQAGIWSEGTGQLEGTVISGPAPSDPDFTGSLNFAFNDRGRVTFENDGIWVGFGDSIERIVAPGVPVNSDGGFHSFTGFSRPAINRQGTVTFLGASYYNAAILVTNVHGNSVIAETHPSGTSPDTQFGGFRSEPPVINGSGHVAFYAVAAPATRGIWSNSSGELALVAGEGFAAPGLGDGVMFGWMSPQAIDKWGNTLLYSSLSGSSVTSQNNQSLWKQQDGQLQLVAREGDQAPTLAFGVEFASLLPPTFSGRMSVANDRGDFAFHADLRGTGVTPENHKSIWAHRGDQLELIARRGEQAPDAALGEVFWKFSTPTISSSGRIAFGAFLTGRGVTSPFDFGIWADDGNGNFQLVVREGDQIDVDPGPGTDLRQISELHMTDINLLPFFTDNAGQNSQPYAFNNRGQIAFRAFFTDLSSAIVVANTAVVPEASAGAALAAAACFCSSIARRRPRDYASFSYFCRMQSKICRRLSSADACPLLRNFSAVSARPSSLMTLRNHRS
jgi:hypothetical protein